MSKIQEYLDILEKTEGSDLHLKQGVPAMVRVAGELQRIDKKVLTREEITAIAKELLGEECCKQYEKQKDFDAAFQVPGKGRYRVSAFFQRGSVGLVLRRVKTSVPTFEQLMLPPLLETVALAKSGLIVVSGPTGNGKSSTLAAMLNAVNEKRAVHILTMEDPIEYLHNDKMGSVTQREVGIDTKDFQSALRHCLRQDPDVIMIGEMRDPDSMLAAMQAAEVGRLVLTTLHATDAAGVVPRILDLFPKEHRDPVRVQLAGVLTAAVCQRLVPTGREDKPVVPSIELMIATGQVRKLIREDKLHKLYASIETGQEFGMRTFNQSLLELVQNGFLKPEQALRFSLHPESLKLNLQGIFLNESRRILQDD